MKENKRDRAFLILVGLLLGTIIFTGSALFKISTKSPKVQTFAVENDAIKDEKTVFLDD